MRRYREMGVLTYHCVCPGTHTGMETSNKTRMASAALTLIWNDTEKISLVPAQGWNAGL